MKHAKPVSTTLGSHFKLIKRSCSSSKKEKGDIASTIYFSTIGSLMYAMVCTQQDIAMQLVLLIGSWLILVKITRKQ